MKYKMIYLNFKRILLWAKPGAMDFFTWNLNQIFLFQGD